MSMFETEDYVSVFIYSVVCSFICKYFMKLFIISDCNGGNIHIFENFLRMLIINQTDFFL